MPLMLKLLLAVQVISALAIIVLVLLQQGKGADMGSAFGSGSSGSLFGAAGSANFLSRTTGVLATLFFLSSLGLTWYAATRAKPQGVMEKGLMEKAVIEKSLPAPKASDVPTPTLPAAPAGGAK